MFVGYGEHRVAAIGWARSAATARTVRRQGASRCTLPGATAGPRRAFRRAAVCVPVKVWWGPESVFADEDACEGDELSEHAAWRPVVALRCPANAWPRCESRWPHAPYPL